MTMTDSNERMMLCSWWLSGTAEAKATPSNPGQPRRMLRHRDRNQLDVFYRHQFAVFGLNVEFLDIQRGVVGQGQLPQQILRGSAAHQAANLVAVIAQVIKIKRQLVLFGEGDEKEIERKNRVKAAQYLLDEFLPLRNFFVGQDDAFQHAALPLEQVFFHQHRGQVLGGGAEIVDDALQLRAVFPPLPLAFGGQFDECPVQVGAARQCGLQHPAHRIAVADPVQAGAELGQHGAVFAQDLITDGAGENAGAGLAFQ
ncbi:hypothetical protein [Methylomonas koyamae]|uniref:hypothetical protein n=1 Tax=Methylomonas koyamae TaxID=702114 RepID=UPI002872D9DC|nr:hypothetical protein [Methylomonas koyamae]WNB78081.1 hypothetical protein RI210_10960 [Methylomonas koyamae]